MGLILPSIPTLKQPVTHSFRAVYSTTTGSASITFSSCDFSTAAAGRQIVVAVMTGRTSGAAVVTGVTIGGVTGTKLIGRRTNNNEATAELWSATVASGATGDVVIDSDIAQAYAIIGVYAVYGAATTATDTASDFNDATTLTDTIDVPAKGLIIACASFSGAPCTTAWSGATERHDTVTALNLGGSSASLEYATAQSGMTITATLTNSGGANGTAMVAATWGQV